MKLIDVLNEDYGVSFKARSWANIIQNEIKRADSNLITIFGKEYPTEYDNFPVDIFVIKVFKKGYPKFDEIKSGFYDNKFVVYFELPIDTTITILHHELRHAYDAYNFSKKDHSKKLLDDKNTAMFFSNDFENFMTNKISGDFGVFKTIMTDLYFINRLETQAFSENIYDDAFGLLNKYRLLKNISYNIKDPNIKKHWNEIKTKVNIPIFNKFKDPFEFIAWAQNKIRYKSEKIFNKFQKIKYLKNKKDEI